MVTLQRLEGKYSNTKLTNYQQLYKDLKEVFTEMCLNNNWQITYWSTDFEDVELRIKDVNQNTVLVNLYIHQLSPLSPLKVRTINEDNLQTSPCMYVDVDEVEQKVKYFFENYSTIRLLKEPPLDWIA